MENSSKRIVYYLAIFIGSAIGDYIPTLFGANFLSLWSILASTLGALLFIYLAYKFLENY